MSIIYVSGDLRGSDGAQIVDQRLVSSLRDRGVRIRVIQPRCQRALQRPFWRARLPGFLEVSNHLRELKKNANIIVLSHEKFFAIAHHMPIDVLIVHNYMPCFSFPRKRWVEAYYRGGSRAFFGRAFSNAGGVVFLSHRDYRHAINDFPQIADRSVVMPPPPHRAKLSHSRDDIIHVSGTADWLPKRLSRLKSAELNMVEEAGFCIEDFGRNPSPAFGLIHDRFTVGFKLKLMQMLYVGDAIASLSEIREEVNALVPDYPWWREVTSADEAVIWFKSLRNDPAWRAHCAQPLQRSLPDWPKMAGGLEKLLKTRCGIDLS